MTSDPEWARRIGTQAAVMRHRYQVSLKFAAAWYVFIVGFVLVGLSINSRPDRIVLALWVVPVAAVSFIVIAANFSHWRKRLIYETVRALFTVSDGRVRRVSDRTLSSLSRFDEWATTNSIPRVHEAERLEDKSDD